MSERNLRSEDLLTHHASACAFRSASQRVRRGCWTLVIPISSRTGEPPSWGLRDGNGTPVAQHARYSDVRLPRLVGVRRARPRTRQFRRPSTLNTVERERALADLADDTAERGAMTPRSARRTTQAACGLARTALSSAARWATLPTRPSRWRGAPHEVRVFGDQSPLRAPRNPGINHRSAPAWTEQSSAAGAGASVRKCQPARPGAPRQKSAARREFYASAVADSAALTVPPLMLGRR